MERSLHAIANPEPSADLTEATEHEFLAFLNLGRIGMVQADPSGRILRVNAAFANLTGYAEQELLGRHFFEITHPDDREPDRKGFLQFAAGDAAIYEVEKRYVRKDGSSVWVQVTVTMVRDNAGRPLRAAAIIQNINARKEAEAAQRAAVVALQESERQQRMLAQVGELGARISNLSALTEAVGRCVASEFRVSRCGFAEVDVPAGRITVTNDFHDGQTSLAGVYGLHEYTDYYLEDALAGRVVIVDDTATDQRTAAKYEQAFAPIALRSHLTVPLHRAGEWVAGFWITHHEPHHWTPSVIETMKLIAERVWAVMERRRAEDQLRVNEERFRSVFENMSEGLVIFGPNGDVIYQNAASLRIHGFDSTKQGLLSHEQVAATWRIWDENDRQIAYEEWPVARVLRRESFQNQILRVQHVENGREFHGSYNGSPICDPSGRLILGFITIRDLTAQVRAQKALEKSQRRAQAFFNSDMMGAICWTMDGRITDANNRFLQMMGYSRDELVGGQISWDQMTPPEYRALDENAMKQLRETGLDTPYEKEYIRKDGSRLPVFLGAAMLDDRRFEGIAFVLDISERKHAEQALRESEQQFRALAESMPNLAWWANPDGYLTWYNQRWYDYTGTTPEQMAGWGWQSVHDPQVLPRVIEEWKKAIATGQLFEMEFPLRGADGKFRWFLTRVIPVKDETGKVVRWFGTNTDVSALRDARETLTRSKEQLENVIAQRTAQLQDVVKELTTFSYSISHDLRSPLRTITGFAELVISDYGETVPDEARSHLERIARAARRMDALITDVLQYSRVSQAELHIETIDPEPIVRDIVEANFASFDGASINIVGPFPRVRASRTALEQAVANLIANALKFSRAGVPPVITVGAEHADPQTVRLYVQDNGIGIAPENQDKVWGMFERLNSTYDGTGIGLAIVRRAVERMGGKAGVESTPGVGSTFWIELPIALD